MVGIVVAVVVAAWAANGRAQPAKQSDPAGKSAKAEAKKIAAAAKRDYLLGNFARALAAYKRAYDTYPAPGLLFNLGQCHSKLGNWEMAIFSYQAYLRERPDTKNRPVVEELLRDAQAARDKQKRAADAKRRDEERRKREAAERKQRAKQLVTPPRPVAVAKSTPVYKRWWFWTAVGAVATSSVIILATSGDTVVLPERSLGILDRR